jgi:hypothetical protein
MERRINENRTDSRSPTERKLLKRDGDIRSVLWIFGFKDYAVLIESASIDSLGEQKWTEVCRYYYNHTHKTTQEAMTARLLRESAEHD